MEKHENLFKTVIVSVMSIASIETLKQIMNFAPEISFVIQTAIGVLTIVYLIKKIFFKTQAK